MHHGRAFRADRTKAPLKAAPVVESAAAGSADTFRINDGGDAQPNGDGAEAVPDGLARPDDLVSSVGIIREGQCRGARQCCGSAKFTLKKEGAVFEDEEYCTPYAGPPSVEHQALHLPASSRLLWM